MTATAQPSAPTSPRAAGLTPAQLKALKPHVISLTDGRLDKEATPEPRSVADFATVEADIDAIFSTYLPAFIDAQGGASVPIVLWAHGGLVDEEAGFAGAQRQVEWWKAHGVYPIHFVWKTGAWTAIWDAIGRWVSGGSRGPLGDAKDWLIEEGARALGGEQVWLDMKLDAAASSDPSGGAKRFVQKLATWMKAHPDAVTVHAVGHSAGSIFHSHLIPVALDAGVPRFETVSFLAPAVRMDTFRTKLLPRSDRIGNLAIFTMTDEAELDDNCFTVYGRSLLYLVAASFEANRGTAILGLAKDIAKDAAVTAFLSGPGGEVIFTPNGKKSPSASTATSHGDFDDDGPTMESVLLRVTGLRKVKVPFPTSDAREIAPWSDVVPIPAATRGTGGARALCIGIDDYLRPADRLTGAVKDAELWGSVLTGAGFAVTPLTNRDATKSRILGSIFQLISDAAAGDVLVVQYSGHGTYAPDLAGGDEDDAQDEALCPVDFRDGGLVLDDDLAKLWDLIPDGVALTIFFDSCHSGGANRDVGGPIDTLPRGVELTARDEDRFRVARGVEAPTGKKRALELVRESEPDTVDEPVDPTPRQSEVLFSACTATQFAWETNGQGDFTGSVAPLIAENIGKVSNAEFFETIVDGFDAHRQDPTFTADEAFAAAPFLATTFADRTASTTPAQPGSAATRDVGRDAAIAQILRGVADLLES